MSLISYFIEKGKTLDVGLAERRSSRVERGRGSGGRQRQARRGERRGTGHSGGAPNQAPPAPVPGGYIGRLGYPPPVPGAYGLPPGHPALSPYGAGGHPGLAPPLPPGSMPGLFPGACHGTLPGASAGVVPSGQELPGRPPPAPHVPGWPSWLPPIRTAPAPNANSAPHGFPGPVPLPPVTREILQSLPPPLQKQIIGERLFPLVARQVPQFAGKLTGMLLELDNGILVDLLHSELRLRQTVGEAQKFLESQLSR